MPTIIIILLVAFVGLISVTTIVRNHKQRKNESNTPTFKPQMQYQKRLSTTAPKGRLHIEQTPERKDYIPKHNTTIDYREPTKKKDDYADWGE